MAGVTDSLNQSLGFDASEAIKALENLDKALVDLGSGLTSLGDQMGAWNARGGATVQVLKDIATHGASAADAMAKLMATFNQKPAMGPVGRPLGPNDLPGAAGFTGGPGGSGAAPPPPPPPPVVPPVVPPVNPKPIEDATRHTREFTLSWEGLLRVVQTQAIVRALSMIRDAAKEAFESNIQFVRSLTELRTLSPEKDLDKITASVAGLAKEFNVPLAQVVEAQYQAMSHQFAETAQQTDIVTAALKVSKIAMVDAGKAADVIASALQAYGKEASDAGLVTAKIERAAQQGHMRFTDFSQILGRVAPLAREAGVSFDELLAAIDALAIAGVRQGEIATTLRASMQALIKPNRDLKEEMQGVSGEGQIAAYDLMQAWAKIRGDTNGTVAEMAKFITSARGMSGAIRLTGQGADAFANSLQGIKTVTAGGLNVDFKMAQSTDVAQVTKEINKLHIALTTDLGASMVATLNKILNFVGGADTVVSVFRALLPILEMAGAALVGIGGTLLIIKANAALAAKGLSDMGGFFKGAMMVEAAVGLGHLIADAFERAQTGMIERLREESKKRIEQLRADLEEAHAAQTAANERTVQEAAAAVNRLVGIHQQEVKSTIQATADWRDQTKIAMDSLITARERGVRALRDLANESNRGFEQSAQRIADLEANKSDWIFRLQQRAKDFNAPGSRADATYLEPFGSAAARAERLTAQALEAAKAARSERDAANVENLLKRAATFAEEAASGPQYRPWDRYEAEERILAVYDAQIQAQRILQETQRKQAQAAAEAAAEEEAKAKRMRELAREILKEGTLTNQQNEPLTDRQREERLANVRAKMTEFQELAFSGGKWQVSDLLNFADFKRKMELAFKESVTEAEITQLKLAPDTLTRLNRQMTDQIQPGLVPLFANLVLAGGGDPTKLVGKTFMQQAQEATRQTQAQNAATVDLTKKSDDVVVAQQTIADKAKEIGNIFRQNESTVGRMKALLTATGSTAWFRSGDSLQAEIDRVRHLQQLVSAQANNPNFGMEQWKALARRAVENYEQHSTLFTEADNKALGEALLALKDIAAERDKIRKAGEKSTLGTELQDAQRGMDGVKSAVESATKEQGQMTGAAAATDHALNNAGHRMEGFVNQIHLAVDAMQELAMAAAGVPVPGGEEAGLAAAKGGMAFLAGGGRPRGTDTIPAMLSPGEMVMSAATTRRFASQLTAMNAGLKPSFHSTGGSVTNIGDINVKVEGGNSGVKTARAIATELRRELRRGTSVL